MQVRDLKIGDKTLAEWREFARRDDCLERMVPSDLRLILMAIEEEREACAVLAGFWQSHYMSIGDMSKSDCALTIRDAIRDRPNHTVVDEPAPVVVADQQ